MVLRSDLIKFVDSLVEIGVDIDSPRGYLSSCFEDRNRSLSLLVGKCGFVFYNSFFGEQHMRGI